MDVLNQAQVEFGFMSGLASLVSTALDWSDCLQCNIVCLCWSSKELAVAGTSFWDLVGTHVSTSKSRTKLTALSKPPDRRAAGSAGFQATAWTLSW